MADVMLPLLAALVSIAVMYVLGERIFRQRLLAIVNAGAFAATPLLWLELRPHPASVYAVACLVVALLCVASADGVRAAWWAAGGGAAVGIAAYVSILAGVMMPLYAALIVGVLASERPVRTRVLVAFTAAFVVVVMPFALFWLRHPDAYRQIVLAHRLYDANRFNVLQGIHDMVSWVGLTARSEIFYDYFNPAFLFLTWGLLFPPVVVLVPIGVYHVLSDESSAIARCALLGFLAAPFAGALTAEPPQPGRIVFIMPFAALLSTYGVARLIAARTRLPGRGTPPTAEARPYR